MIASSHGRILFIVLEKIKGEKSAYYVIMARDATKSEKKIYKTRGIMNMMGLPRYTEKEIDKIIDAEIRELIESGKAEFKPVDEFPEFKDAKFVSVYIGDKIPVRGHYRKINGKRVYIRPYLRRRRKK